MSSRDKVILDLIDTTDKLLEQIEENWSSDLRTVKQVVVELREELEEVLESHDSQE
jgi:hypothetical protein